MRPVAVCRTPLYAGSAADLCARRAVHWWPDCRLCGRCPVPHVLHLLGQHCWPSNTCVPRLESCRWAVRSWTGHNRADCNATWLVLDSYKWRCITQTKHRYTYVRNSSVPGLPACKACTWLKSGPQALLTPDKHDLCCQALTTSAANRSQLNTVLTYQWLHSAAHPGAAARCERCGLLQQPGRQPEALAG